MTMIQKNIARYLLLLCLMGTLGACKKNNTSSTTGTTTTGTTGTGTTTTTNTNPEVIEVTACASATGMQKIICLADALKAKLTATQLASLQLSYTKANAIKWSNFPQALVSSAYKRVGLNFGAMTTEQVQYAKALLKEIAGSATTNEGWDELQQILNADDYLNSLNPNGGYGTGNYYLAFLGTPATTGTFEIQFGGHHVAFANTYTNGTLVGATPSFRGIEPLAAFTYNNRTNVPLTQEHTAFITLLASLSTSELASARLSPAVGDLICGPQQDNNFPTVYSGIKVSNLSTAQKELVLTALKTYVLDVADNAAFLTKYQNELNDTYISFSGNIGLMTRGDYVRIDGPSLWIEWAAQGGVVTTASHPHSVWRDKQKDYGGN